MTLLRKCLLELRARHKDCQMNDLNGHDIEDLRSADTVRETVTVPCVDESVPTPSSPPSMSATRLPRCRAVSGGRALG
jgi:hypothetical protein